MVAFGDLPVPASRGCREAMRRLFSSSSPAHGRHTLPILRLPTTIFPHQCFSLSLEPPEHERRYNVLSPPQLQEAWSEHGGRLAALAWGSSVGVELQLLQLDDAEAPHAPLPTPPLVHHAVGGRRLRLLELLDERSGAGSRLGVVSPLDDECIDGGASAAEPALLRAEADAARALLHSAATPLELSLCTLDEVQIGRYMEIKWRYMGRYRPLHAGRGVSQPISPHISLHAGARPPTPVAYTPLGLHARRSCC